jgi:hypothetical protein
MIPNLFSRWKGVLVYGPEYDDMEGVELFFTMNILQDKDSFTGTAVDTGGAGITPGEATIRGFIDKNEISFVKQYNASWEYDHQGIAVPVPGKPGPEIVYTGIYDPHSGEISGDWEISLDEQPVGYGYLSMILTGTFRMARNLLMIC